MRSPPPLQGASAREQGAGLARSSECQAGERHGIETAPGQRTAVHIFLKQTELEAIDHALPDLVLLGWPDRAQVAKDRHRFLPPYSPDLNPIEQAFAKCKQLTRSAAPRTRDTLWNTIGAIIGRFTATECQNFLANSGYAHSARFRSNSQFSAAADRFS